ncbi:MAG TPA: cyclase family protein [Candidatus Methylomirabilis sp.]|nr:cyclase family protein [Candidatus Methylomirabilis sp.]
MTQDSLTALFRGRKVFDLGVELYHGMPHHPLHTPFMYQMLRTHGDLMYGEGVTAALDMFGMNCHTGTHLDGLGHFAKNLCLHGGVPAEQGQSKTEGIKTCGIQQVAPILRRGILLDVAGTQGVEILSQTQTVGPAELEAAAKAAKVEIRQGDVVLVRTGWIRHWPDSRKYYSIQTGQPGLNVEAARWATDQGAFCIGSDNFAVEYVPSPGNTMPVHIHCLVEKGVHLLEVVNLEELARTRTPEFLLLLIPMKIRGGTASPVRPVAVV